MENQYFTPEHLRVLDHAAGISEEVTSDFFHFSSRQWRRMPYEVLTLRDVRHWEHPGQAFAQLVVYSRPLKAKRCGRDSYQFYRICLHDHEILGQTVDGREDQLLPFLIYILTHELVHVVRFGRYDQSPLTHERGAEESRVHQLTHQILGSVPIKGLPGVLRRFARHAQTSVGENAWPQRATAAVS